MRHVIVMRINGAHAALMFDKTGNRSIHGMRPVLPTDEAA